MKKETLLFVEVDTNDADYISEEFIIDPKDMVTIRKVCNLIKNEKPLDYHNWATGEHGSARDSWTEEQLSDEEIDTFNDYIPYFEYGTHNINRVEIREVSILEKLV